MDRKKALRDPALWILAGTNIYLIWYYFQRPEVFTTLVWLYWWQSVLLGVFNILDMLTIRKAAPLAKGTSDMFALKGPAAAFFLFHYGLFHLVYGIFLRTMKVSGPFEWDLFKPFFIAFLFGQIISFVQHKIQQRKEPADLGRMFSIPYVRIIPMHLTILIPNFLPFTNLGVFVVLKSFADVLMYMITSKTNKKSVEMDKAALISGENL
ncbi:MAG: hypothetical protein JWQ38_1405 [Flavipsychrobacter sp.]|nr:hypothetical protein [Flavipsychrobacter sp.]